VEWVSALQAVEDPMHEQMDIPEATVAFREPVHEERINMKRKDQQRKNAMC